MPERIDVDRALAILEGDAELPREWRVVDFVLWDVKPQYSNAVNRSLGVERVIPNKVFARWWNQRKGIQRRYNRDVCERIPVACQRCGSEFHRDRINQVNCRPCIELLRSVVKGVDHA